MTNEQIIKEFERWIKAGRPAVWYKSTTSNPRWLASGRQNTCWRYSDTIYIVDDEQAELRKLQIDKPDTKFQAYYNNKWTDTTPSWFIDRKYRVKPLEWYEDPNMIGRPVWVRDEDNEKWGIDIFVDYTDDKKYPFLCRNSDWTFAKPVKPEECYQGVSDG